MLRWRDFRTDDLRHRAEQLDIKSGSVLTHRLADSLCQAGTLWVVRLALACACEPKRAALQTQELMNIKLEHSRSWLARQWGMFSFMRTSRRARRHRSFHSGSVPGTLCK
jgi:hypothetical protein